jgi:hypothetical protein
MKFRMFLLLMLLAVSCVPQPQATPGPDTAVTSPPEGNTSTNEPNVRPFSPQPGDADLTRGNIYINESSLVIRESYPPQISLSISGDLPTPCNQLRAEVSPPDQENNIKMDVYTVIDPDKVCIQVLEPFEENIDLGTFPTGHYAVWVNGEKVGEFDA